MNNKKIALFIFDMIIVAITVSGVLVALGAMEAHDAEQVAKNNARIAEEQSQRESMRHTEWVLLMDKGEMMTTFKAAMK